MTDRRDNGPKQPDWMPEPHACPFCTIDARICGCPTGEALTVGPNVVLGED